MAVVVSLGAAGGLLTANGAAAATTTDLTGLLGAGAVVAAVAAVALPLVAYAFHALGRLQAQRADEAERQALRHELRQRLALNPQFAWRSDGTRQLLQCLGPQGSPMGLREAFPQALAEALSSTPALVTRLQAQAAFDEVEIVLPARPVTQGSAALSVGEGAQPWRLSGRPLHDAQGHYLGHVGQARPLRAERQDRLRAQALQASLQALVGPALAQEAAQASVPAAALALNEGQGFVLQLLGPGLQAAWPSAAEGLPLAACLGELPAPVASALQGLLQRPASGVAAGVGTRAALGQRQLSGGWWLQTFEAAPGIAGLWLGLQPAASQVVAGAGEAEQFSMTISHDLRAPVRVVEGFTRIVKEDYGHLLDRVGNDHLDRVLAAAARMNLMIDALLTLARLSTQPLLRQPVNLSQLAQYVVEDLRRGAPEREAEIEIEAGLTVNGDPTLLRLVLENLLGNAWKYTGRCSRARISLRSLPQEGMSADAAPGAHGPLRGFEVRDNGAGFDMRSADRLFGLFQRLHSANDFPGHGVGLASVKRIIQRHGGDIWAEAEPGRGASFRFTLAP